MNTLITGGSGLVGSCLESKFKPSSKDLNLFNLQDIINYIQNIKLILFFIF